MDLDVHLQAIIGGDADAFGQWMAGGEARVRASLASFARVIDVEAVLQEALLRVWQVAPRFVPDGRENGLVRLAIRIARNLAVSEVRKIKTTESGDLEAEVATEVRGADPMLRAAILDCRDKLPAQPRKALDARLAGGDDDSALASQIGMRLNTFLQNFSRARKLLAECLGRRGIVVDQELGA